MAHFPGKLVFLVFLSFYVQCYCNTLTMLQLKDSVAFSYSITNWFLDIIRGNRPPTAIVETFANLMSSHDSRVSFRSIEPAVSSYLGFGICALLGLIFAVSMPVIGLIFCCARCCGKCGGRIQLMDSKKDPCKRITYSVFVMLIVTVQLVAIVLVFINHFLLHEALVNSDSRIGALSQINSSMADTSEALDNMYKMALNTSSVNLADHKERFKAVVDGKLKLFRDELIRISGADRVSPSISALQDVLLSLDAGSETKETMEQLNTSLGRLIDQLPTVRQNLIDTLDSNCPYELHIKCTQLMETAKTQLMARYSFDTLQLMEVFSMMDQLRRNTRAITELNEFKDNLNAVDQVLTDAIDHSLNSAWTDLAHSPATREKMARSFEQYVKQFNVIAASVQTYLKSHRTDGLHRILIRSMESRLYGGIALLCVPVLIIMLMYLGLCFGTCGHRPYDEAGICNRGVGANLLLGSVGFSFIFSSILMVICTILFLVGGPVQTDGCRYLTGHITDGPKRFDDYFHQSLLSLSKLRRDANVQQSQYDSDHLRHPKPENHVVKITPTVRTMEILLNLSKSRPLDAILTRCESEPFVEAISWAQLISPVLNENIQPMLQKVTDAFKGVDLVLPLQKSVQSCMDALDRINFVNTANFSEAFHQVGLPITYIDDMEQYLRDLRTLNMQKLNTVIEKLMDHTSTFDRLRPKMQQVYTNLNELPDVHELVTQQLVQFNENLVQSVTRAVEETLEKLEPLLLQQFHLAVIATWRDIPCKELRSAVKLGVDAVCITILLPLNALWAGLGLILLLFIPLIVFAVKLAGLYRKTEKYSPDYDEPDYITYHGFYMRPQNESSVGPLKSKSKGNSKKVKSRSPNSKKAQNSRTNVHSRYHQVSVYPYDAYE